MTRNDDVCDKDVVSQSTPSRTGDGLFCGSLFPMTVYIVCPRRVSTLLLSPASRGSEGGRWAGVCCRLGFVETLSTGRTPLTLQENGRDTNTLGLPVSP